MWWLLWLLIGIAIGAAVVWAVIKRRVDDEIAATQASYESRLAHVQAEVGRADQAHEETKVTLRELLADRNAANERAQRLDDEAAAARRLAATAQAHETKTTADLAAARDEVDGLKAELAQCRQRGREAEARAAETKSLVDELEARIREMPQAPAAHDAAPPPPPSHGGDGDEAAARLKAIEAKLAELPVGITAHTALKQERDELLRVTGGDLPLMPGMPSADPSQAEPAAPQRPVSDGRAQRLKAIEAKLRMLPAGSSARATLLAEKARLVDAGDVAPSLPPAPVGASHDDLEIIKGIGPVINGELMAMGIVTFAQLVALTPAQIDYIEDKIGFPGRVVREHWIEQARDLMAGSAPA